MALAILKRFLAKNGVDNNSNTLINVATPVGAQDAANKQYVDDRYVSSDALINDITVGKGLGSAVSNTALGVTALSANTTGALNTASGYQALQNNTSGLQNTAFGSGALSSNTSGSYNTAVGVNAMDNNTTGTLNSAVGINALANNTTGTLNNAFGYNSLQQNTAGTENSAFGRIALGAATTSVNTLGTITGGTGYTNGTYTGVVMTLSSGSTAGTYPTATIVVSGGAVTSVTITSPGSAFKDTTTVLTAPAASIGGTGSGFSVPVATIVSAGSNTAFGSLALRYLYRGNYNTAIGVSAGTNLTNASNNTFIGLNAGSGITTGSNNVIIGNYTGSASPISGVGNNNIVLADGAGNLRQFIDSSGNVGIGTSSPISFLAGGTKAFVVNDATSATSAIGVNGSVAWYAKSDSGGTVNGEARNLPLLFATNNAERMRIDSSGNVGIGTSTPSAKLHVSSGRSYFVANSEPYSIGMKYGTTAGLDYFYIGATNSATPSCVFSNAGGIELMRIDNSGNLLVGTTSTISDARVSIANTNAGRAGLGIGNTGGSSVTSAISFRNSNGEVGTIQTSGSATAYNTSSDQRLKENIVDAPSALTSVNAIKVRSFDWKSSGEHQEYGYIAQELIEIAPEAVSIPVDDDEMMGVDFGRLTPRLVKAIQEQQALIEQLNARITALEGN